MQFIVGHTKKNKYSSQSANNQQLFEYESETLNDADSSFPSSRWIL